KPMLTTTLLIEFVCALPDGVDIDRRVAFDHRIARSRDGRIGSADVVRRAVLTFDLIDGLWWFGPTGGFSGRSTAGLLLGHTLRLQPEFCNTAKPVMERRLEVENLGRFLIYSRNPEVITRHQGRRPPQRRRATRVFRQD